VCLLDAAGSIVVHKDLRAIAPYRNDFAVTVECPLAGD
jgi:hypothetical protein